MLLHSGTFRGEWLCVLDEGKVVPVHSHRAMKTRWKVEVKLYTFVTSAVDRGE